MHHPAWLVALDNVALTNLKDVLLPFNHPPTGNHKSAVDKQKLCPAAKRLAKAAILPLTYATNPTFLLLSQSYYGYRINHSDG